MPSIKTYNFQVLTCAKGNDGISIDIIFDADDTLSPANRQYIATQSGLSHLAFLSSSMIADFRLDCVGTQTTTSSIQEAAIAAVGFLKAQRILPGKGVAFETSSGVCASIVSSDRALIDQRITPSAWKPIASGLLPTMLSGITLPGEILKDGIVKDSVMMVDDILFLPLISAQPQDGISSIQLPPLRSLNNGGFKGLLLISVERSGIDLQISATPIMRPSASAPAPLQLGGWILHWLKCHHQQLPAQIAMDLASGYPHSTHCHVTAPLAAAQAGGSNLLIGGHWSAGPVSQITYPEIAA